jgi:hypothetical protein
MTKDTRGAIADLAAVAAVSVALYFVARKPELRRVVWRALKYGVLTAAPNLVRQEVTKAWAASAIPHSDRNLQSGVWNLE